MTIARFLRKANSFWIELDKLNNLKKSHYCAEVIGYIGAVMLPTY
jgi:hypothetical protein